MTERERLQEKLADLTAKCEEAERRQDARRLSLLRPAKRQVESRLRKMQ